MAKDQYKRVTDLIEALAPVWQERMGLSHMHVEHAFLDTYYGDDGEEDFKITACTEARWQYLQAKVKWYLPSAVRHDDDTLEKTLVHELSHVLLAPEQTLIDTKLTRESDGLDATDAEALSDRYYEHLELATEMTTRAIMAGWQQ